MFGLEGRDKKKKTQSFAFDLEKKLAEKEYRQEVMDDIYKQVTEIKELIKEGSTKEVYEEYSRLLNGYHGLLKVISRFEKNKS